MLQLSLFVLLLAFIFDSARAGSSSSDSNLYFASVFTNLRSHLPDYTSLPNFHTEFKDKLLAVTSNVNVNYNPGNLTGLYTIGRYLNRNCSAPYLKHGNSTINCTLTFNGLKIKQDAKVKYGVLPEKTAHILSNITGTEIFVVTTALSSHNFPVLQEFTVKNLGQFHTKVTGLLNLNLPNITRTFENVSRTNVMSTLIITFRSNLYDSIRSVPMPLP